MIGWAAVVGWCATFTGAVLGLPQLLRLVRTRDVGGLSLVAWQSILVINLIWLVHGLRIAQPPQVVVNAIALVTTVPLVVLLARSVERSLLVALTPCFAAALAIIAVDHYLGSLAYGIVAIVPGITSCIGQTLELVRAPEVSGVSTLFLVLAFVNQALWATWGALVDDPGSVVTAASMTVLTGLNFGWYVARRLGLGPMFIGRHPADTPRRRAPL